MDRQRKIQEDAVVKTLHLLVSINLLIVKKEFPLSIYKLAEEKRISTTAVRAMFKMGIIKHDGSKHTGKFIWAYEGHPDRTLAIRVMNMAMELRGTKKTSQQNLIQAGGDVHTLSGEGIDELKLKFFKLNKKPIAEPSLFSSVDEKFNHVINVSANIANAVYSTKTELELKNQYSVINDEILIAAKDLVDKIYRRE